MAYFMIFHFTETLEIDSYPNLSQNCLYLHWVPYDIHEIVYHHLMKYFPLTSRYERQQSRKWYWIFMLKEWIMARFHIMYTRHIFRDFNQYSRVFKVKLFQEDFVLQTSEFYVDEMNFWAKRFPNNIEIKCE